MQENDEKRLKTAVAPLLEWYAVNARDLPWRREVTPYRVWISEIMLQQTRVETVKAYFLRFMREVPTLAALAALPEEQLLKLWEGLGYYSRARNLQRAARQILADHQGIFPSTRRELLALPGIGEYTAGAILSIAFGQAEPAVDGNVLRVLSRLTGSREDIAQETVKRSMRDALLAVWPAGRSGAFTQALMELGALVCVPHGEPQCSGCPWRHSCASASGSWHEIPVKTKAKARKVEFREVWLISCQGRWAIRRRPAKGLLSGLWEFPNVLIGGERPADVTFSDRKLTAAHIFTHVEWKMTGIPGCCEHLLPEYQWVTPEELRASYPLPGAFQHFLAFLDKKAEKP